MRLILRTASERTAVGSDMNNASLGKERIGCHGRRYRVSENGLNKTTPSR
jgi:hypothetical protein